jgi:hypothetical protein
MMHFVTMHRYIKWSHEEKARGALSIDLAVLQERCIKQFCGYAMYLSDDRFVSVCLSFVCDMYSLVLR